MNVFPSFPGGLWHSPNSHVRAIADQEDPRRLALRSSPDGGMCQRSCGIVAEIRLREHKTFFFFPGDLGFLSRLIGWLGALVLLWVPQRCLGSSAK